MRKPQVLIHQANLVHNLAQVRCFAPGRAVCVSVKTNAYGHGAVPSARILAAAGAEWMGVASLEEARELRESGISQPVLIYGLASAHERTAIVKEGFDIFVSGADEIDDYEKVAARLGKPARLHLKVDTGMGRIGCPLDCACPLAARIHESKNLVLAGLATHFPCADEGPAEPTSSQWQAFQRVVKGLADAEIRPELVHAANSGAILLHPQTHADMVRPGIMLYGYPPDAACADKADLRPVMEFRSVVTFVKRVTAGTAVSYGSTWRAPRDTIVATIAAGYGDGFNRLLSNRGCVWAGGRRLPIAGRVCMDQFMVDAGPGATIQPGDEVTLFGPPVNPMPGVPADNPPDAAELAALCGTIPYEITCAVNSRLRRKVLQPESGE